jgi:diaminopimelate decarboxylase
LDAGMTDLLRPSLYGAQHPIITIPQKTTSATTSYVIVGHCCESGDILTPASGNAHTSCIHYLYIYMLVSSHSNITVTRAGITL